ncbi:hypothetical protein ATK74_0855 [Propionicimonas paludicola]|uniref:Uncharacterized protein n=1 Tax=Propionicimonas paludicola TaxID=185243 RepID=A0A2A9CRQ6_9ACTN|nr:hypothetical protein [Propionicimonas paludicola]PFG16320.1 hypothetical protein ATK74_0855 [Propionicimonas paludicola]
MALFTRLRIDPDLATLIGRSAVLAVGTTADGQVVATTDSLWYATGDGWRHQPWHQITHGGWDRNELRLRWHDQERVEHSLHLTETGRVPEVFNERVTESIVVQRVVDLIGPGAAVITARRDLGNPDAALDWRLEPTTGTSLDAVQSDRRVASELARLRSEYDVR